LDIGEVPEGRTRSKYLAVGYSDNTCRILSLDTDSHSCWHKISIQALPAVPESVCFMSSTDSDAFYLHVGLVNGVLVRSLVDNITGSISDTRQEFIGARAIKLTKIMI
jgi:splicing factor 3B subunit 3